MANTNFSTLLAHLTSYLRDQTSEEYQQILEFKARFERLAENDASDVVLWGFIFFEIEQLKLTQENLRNEMRKTKNK